MQPPSHVTRLRGAGPTFARDKRDAKIRLNIFFLYDVV